MRKKDMNYVENGAKMKVLTPLCLQSERQHAAFYILFYIQKVYASSVDSVLEFLASSR